jgi:hypothetical protein
VALPNRSIRWEERFENEFREIMPDIRRADEFLAGVDWKLSRNPETGVLAYPDSAVWMLFMHELPESPSLTIYYTFDDEYVYLLSIQCDTHGFG